MPKLAIGPILLTISSTAARAEDVAVYGAGSLREAIGQIAAEFGKAHGLAVTTQFGPSGRMRERIERGERADLFASADVGHARKLVDDGRASVMAVFARSTVCLLSPAKFAATTETALQARAGVLDTPPGGSPPRSGDSDADAVLDGRVDASIVYCSGRDRYARLLPDATLVPFPPALQVGPEYGLAVLSDARPAALPLAMTILSPKGQSVMAQRGFKPVTLPSE